MTPHWLKGWLVSDSKCIEKFGRVIFDVRRNVHVGTNLRQVVYAALLFFSEAFTSNPVAIRMILGRTSLAQAATARVPAVYPGRRVTTVLDKGPSVVLQERSSSRRL